MIQIDEALGYEDKSFEFDVSGDSDVVGIEVCKDSGLLPNGDACKDTEVRYFTTEDVPTKKCNRHGVQYHETYYNTNSNNDSNDDSNNNE